MSKIIEQLYRFYKYNPQITTDSRNIPAGAIFFALKGPNFNGNTFALEALKQGASSVVVDEDLGVADARIFYVEDVLKALQDLAKMHRNQLQIPVIGITGSNGKTTTKELISAVLAKKYNTATTQGNLNNHIGIPITLLRIQQQHQIAVVEMGANHQKEIEGYCKYALPTHALITNCGKAHLEGFGGVEGVRKGKGELYDYARLYGRTVFACDDYDYLHTMSQGIDDLVWYGTNQGTVTGQVAASEPFLQVAVQTPQGNATIQTQLVGDYNLPNILSAVTIGLHFEVPLTDIQAAIENYAPTNSRSQLLQWQGNHVILDAYNANPTSMKAAIENFAKSTAAHKVVVIGAMAELGTESIAEHRAIVKLLKEHTWQAVALVGGHFADITTPYTYLNDSTEAGEWLRQLQLTNAHILVKGSRSTKMEKILQ
ncbi:MAG: UDP-N-acetylmuramoyl-tripeptide--D-alanyl-D-alanine ligase [Bacteroidetes bacterium]|nr:MAG: UDP-N-acetylmuramoyl-tripeptide--D-alanyl-D-alanine ligase [Bacteroidota bacterium]